MNLTIIGCGYVGLVTGACFAEMGNRVNCVEIDPVKLARLQTGEVPFYEPGLQEMMSKNIRAKRLSFTHNIEAAIDGTSICFIAVGTPSRPDESADLSYVFEVAHAIGRCVKQSLIVVTKSTVPVGTAEQIRGIIANELARRGRTDIPFEMASNPEFLKEGSAIEDFMKPDRVIIGADSDTTGQSIKQLYEVFVRNQRPVLLMDVKSAEMAKYAANAMLATRISFMNEIARLCDATGADIENVRQGIGSDRRIGSAFLYAGTGYGGSCFSKDVPELIVTGANHGLAMEVCRAVEAVNQRQKKILVDLVVRRFGENLAGRHFAVWGLAFKPHTDDMRGAPSLNVIRGLIKRGATIAAYDPVATAQAQSLLADVADSIQYHDNALDVLQNADAAVLVTEWFEFRQIDFAAVMERLKSPILFDGRNQYSPAKMKQQGIEYYCIGRAAHEK